MTQGRWIVFGICASVFIAAPLYAESQVRARLVYERADETPSCPDAPSMRNAVAARLGYDPFVQSADQTVVVRTGLSGEGGALTGSVELRNDDEEILGVRTLDSDAEDCRELAEALVLAIVIAIDPLALSAAPVPETETETETETAAETEVETDAEIEAEIVAEEPGETGSSVENAEPVPERQLRIRARIGVHASLWAAPRVAAGIVVQGGFQWRSLSIGLEGRVDFPADGEFLGGEVKTSLLMLSLVPCFHWRLLAVCGVFGGGALRGEGIGFDEVRKVATQYWVAGGRVGLEVPIIGPLILHGRVDILGAPARTHLTVDDVVVWSTPPVSFAFGAGISGSF